MPEQASRTPYEVYCNQCRVTFPVGTRRCVHCGARLARERFHVDMVLPPTPYDVAIDDEMPRRSGVSPLTLVWVALLLAGYLYRACVT